jgi:hypothetical protein
MVLLVAAKVNGDARRRVAQMNVKTRNRREKDREI